MDNFEEGMYIVTNDLFEELTWRNRIGICSEVRPRMSMFPLEIRFVDNLNVRNDRSHLPLRFREVNIVHTLLLNELLK